MATTHDEREQRAGPAARGSRAGGGWLARALLLALLVLGHAPAAGAAGHGGDARLPEVPAEAQGESGLHRGEARVRARLLVDAADPGARRLRAGILFDLAPGWHLYWKNPGDTGLPTRVTWAVTGGEAGPLRWPAPEHYREADGLFTTFGYSESVLLASDVELSAEPADDRRIAAEAELLVCERECIPASFSLERSLGDALAEAPADARVTALFDRFAALAPVTPETLGVELESLYSLTGLRPGSTFDAAIVVRACVGAQTRAAGDEDAERCTAWQPRRSEVVFYPESDDPVLIGAAAVAEEGSGANPARDGGRIVALAGSVSDEAGASPAARLRGVLALEAPDGRRAHVDVDLPLPPIGAGVEVVALGRHWLPAAGAVPAAPALALWRVVLLALLGGLILNLMPCVLPVLAIKVFGVAELAGRSRSELRRNGAAYALGILASMGVLAGVVLALRAAGSQVGWGFQFQSPLFVSAIAVLLVAFAMNLFGVYEISLDVGAAARLGEQATGARRSFFEGLLAVLLATPCSAPFLGTAVGFAFASSASTIVLIFLCIGAGLAAPFVLVTWVPAWSRFVPRSGPWMLRLRAGLGFALIATVVWLLWIAGGLSGIAGMTSLLALLVAVAFGLWVFGALQSSPHAWLRAAAGLALVLVAVIGLDWIGARMEMAPQPGEIASPEGWAAWDPARVDSTLEQGRPVLVAFSAEWCITCKVNEQVVLQSPQVMAELDRLGVVVFKADWTQRDETIRAELARHGRAGVPLYLVYAPGAPGRPAVLPELLSVGEVVDSLRSAAALARSGAAS